MRLIVIINLLLLISTGGRTCGQVNIYLQTDVCIIGAGSAGIGAALAASRSGAEVILVEKEAKVGGTSIMSYVNTWEPGPGCSFAHEIYQRMSQTPGAIGVAKTVHEHNENNEPYLLWWIDENLKYNSTLRRGGHRIPFDVDEFDHTVRQMLAETGKCKLLLNTSFAKAYTENTRVKSIEAVSSSGENYMIEAKVFVDCTGGAVVCRGAGCEVMVGEEPRSRFGESLAPEEPSIFLNNISLCYQIKPSLDTEYENPGQPEDFDYNVSGWVTGPVGPGKKLSINPYGIIKGKLLLTQSRDSLYAYGQEIVKKQWAKMRTYPFFKNYVFDSYAPQLGIRECYRVVCEYILTQHDLMQGLTEQTHNDIITLADHRIDMHGGLGVKDISDVYGVPYRCLIPVKFDNLFVAGKSAGFSHIAASSCRLSRTMIALGHAAGFAASIAAKEDIPSFNLPVSRIQAEMNLKLRPREKMNADPLPINKVIGKLSYGFLCCDNGNDSIYQISKAGEIIWAYYAPRCQDVWALPNGNILFTYRPREKDRGGVTEITKDKKVVFNYETEGEVHTCQRLDNGNTLIGVNNSASLIEVDKQGGIKKTIQLRTERKGHDAIRMARQLDNGNYLVCQEGDKLVAEYNPKGKFLRAFSSPGKCFDAVRLENGNSLISDGSACSVREVDKKGEVVWQITKDDFPEIKMDWLAGLEVLPNRNILVCNWLGHGKYGQGIPVFEVTKDKKIVFYYTDNVRTKSISNICLIKD